MFEHIRSPYRIEKSRFKVFLAEKNMTQNDFATIISVYPNQVSLAVNNKVPMTNAFILRFKKGLQKCEASKVQISEIIIEK